MLILSPDDVKYCQLKKEISGQKEQFLPGLFYHNFCFFKIDFCPSDKMQQALKTCRKFLDLNPIGTAIILKETEGLSVWLTRDYVKFAEVREEFPEVEGLQETESAKVESTETIDEKFVEKCREKLAETVGPFATVICDLALETDGETDKKNFVTTLAKEIPDADKAQEFYKSCFAS